MKIKLEGEPTDTFEPVLKITKESLRNATPEQRAQWAQIFGEGVLKVLESAPEKPQGVVTVTGVTDTVLVVEDVHPSRK